MGEVQQFGYLELLIKIASDSTRLTICKEYHREHHDKHQDVYLEEYPQYLASPLIALESCAPTKNDIKRIDANEMSCYIDVFKGYRCKTKEQNMIVCLKRSISVWW